MIRSFQELKNKGLRQVLNHAYYEMIGLCVMYKDYEYSSYASQYAKKTVIYSRFDKHRISSTDLYNIFAFLNNLKTEKLSKKDEILIKRAKLDMDFYIRYLRRMMNGSLSVVELDRFIKRITKELYIEDSILKSLGYMAVNWNRISLRERKLTLDKMSKFGMIKFRYSDVSKKIREFNAEFEIDEDKYKKSLDDTKPDDNVESSGKLSKNKLALAAIGGHALYRFMKNRAMSQKNFQPKSATPSKIDDFLRK